MSSSDSKINTLHTKVEKSVGADKKYHHVALGDWQEVFGVQEVTSTLWTESFPEFHKDTTYYKTIRGSPEGGYFVKVKMGEGDNLNCASCDSVWKVRRGFYQPWTIEEIPDAVLEYEPATEGRTARCRVIEVYSLYDSQIVSQRHSLWGNAIEIVKALRDGYSSRDSEYQHICLGIILEHFTYMDKYLDLVPKESCPTYKEVLHHWARKQENDDESSEEDSSEEEESSEDEGELCVDSSGHAFLVKNKVAHKAKAVEEADGTIKYVKADGEN